MSFFERRTVDVPLQGSQFGAHERRAFCLSRPRATTAKVKRRRYWNFPSVSVSILSWIFVGVAIVCLNYSVYSICSYVGGKILPLDAGFSNPLMAGPDVKLYIYDDPVFFPNVCRNGKDNRFPRSYYFDVMDEWLDQLRSSSGVTVDSPDDASLIFVPFNADDSFAAGECDGLTHYDRMQNVINFLLRSPIFQRHYGKDHIWPIGHYRLHFRNGTGIFNASMPAIISNMTISTFIDWKLNLGKPHYGIDISFTEGKQRLRNIWRIMQYWRCTITTPIFTLPSAWAPDISFEKWNKRRYLLHYRGKGKNCSSYPNWRNPNDVRYAVNQLKNVIPNSLISHERHENEEGFGKELQDSKFCLSLRCDDPLASRFYDALAAGCFPVIISEGWMLAVAPFAEQLNYNKFSISIPESLFWHDPVASMRFVYNHQESYLRRMYKNLQEARRILLWRHPQSQTALVALNSASIKCKDLDDDYIGQEVNIEKYTLSHLTRGYFLDS